jgi:hypothetical protein
MRWLVAASVQACDAVEKRAWSHPQEPTTADLLLVPSWQRRKERPTQPLYHFLSRGLSLASSLAFHLTLDRPSNEVGDICDGRCAVSRLFAPTSELILLNLLEPVDDEGHG